MIIVFLVQRYYHIMYMYVCMYVCCMSLYVPGMYVYMFICMYMYVGMYVMFIFNKKIIKIKKN